MTFDDREREHLRRGLALLVDETPVAPEVVGIIASSVRSPVSERRPLAVFVTTGLAVVVVVGGVALLQAGGSGQPIEAGESTVPALVSTTPGSVPTPALGEVHRVVSSSPGWDISYLERDGDFEGDSRGFQHTMIQFTNRSNQAELNLDAGGTDLASLIADREADGTRIDDAMVLGTEAVVMRYDGENDRYTAMGTIGDVVYEFVAEVDESTFRSLLTSLSFVDEEKWNAALPDTVVTDRSAAVVEYLADIPLPPGFDATSLEVGPEEHWYQVGADVVGAVTCAWIDQWIAAKAADDQVAVEQAVDALGTSREWGILIDMSAEGYFSQGVWEYADAIAGDGTVTQGRVLTVEESYQNAIGCPSQ